MRWKDHIDKLGIVGSFVAAACCLGLPAVLSVVTAVGLGFLINDTVLLPLLIVLLALTLFGLVLGYRVHRQPWPLVLAATSAISAYFFIFVRTMKLPAYLAIVGLVIASVLNVVLRRRCAPSAKLESAKRDFRSWVWTTLHGARLPDQARRDFSEAGGNDFRAPWILPGCSPQ